MKLKELIEKRNALLDKADALVKKIVFETRAFNEAEQKEYDGIIAEITGIDKTVKSIEESRSLERKEPAKTEETKEQAEERAFVNYIKGVVETRADVNLTASDNKAVIPSTIANKIIEKVVEMCPVFSLSTHYNVGGTLNIPYYDEGTQKIEMAYADEFADIESTSGKFGSIQLTGFLAGSLSKVSRTLINNAQFDVLGYVVGAMAKSISRWIEKQLLQGTAGKIEGLSKIKRSVTAASATAITADNLIDVQQEVPDVFQNNAIWIMSKKTRTSIRKLKDADGNYILNRDVLGKWNYTLLGKPVYISDNMADMGTGKTSVIYGDMSGLAVKISENINIEVLREKYATQHAIGVVGWLEMDAKIEDEQKLAKLVHA